MLRTVLLAEPSCKCAGAGDCAQRRYFSGESQGRWQSGDLCWRENRARWNSRRVALGVGGIHRRIAAEAAERAGRRSVRREIAARGMHRSDAHWRGRGDSGYGRGRADLLDDGDGLARRNRNRNRTCESSATRNRHDALRNHAQRVAGAHAAGGRTRARTRSAGCFQEVGIGRGGDRRSEGRRTGGGEESRRGRRGNSRSSSGRRRPGVSEAAGCACSARRDRERLVCVCARRNGLNREFQKIAGVAGDCFKAMDYRAVRHFGADEYFGWAGRERCGGGAH